MRTCGLNEADPIAHWKAVHEEQQRIVERLNQGKHLRIVAKDTDLRACVAGRKWINCDGKLNFPDGEIFTGPVEDSVEGHIRYTFPSIYMGQEVADVQLTFEKGKVVKASAAKGEDLLQTLLDTDEGARFVGEIAVGTNFNVQQFSRNILFDEKIGGTVHVAVGASIPDTGGLNKSSLHWDMICNMADGGRIFLDDELIYEKGRFII